MFATLAVMEATAPDDLDFLVERIPQYPHYADEVARRLADELIRSYVGEALALLRERHAAELDLATATRLDEVILRCEFTDQHFVKHLEHVEITESLEQRLLAADRGLAEQADRLPKVRVADVVAVVGDIDAALTARASLVA